jgi:hypothetical protein
MPAFGDDCKRAAKVPKNDLRRDNGEPTTANGYSISSFHTGSPPSEW